MAYGARPQGRYLLIGHQLHTLRESRGLTLAAAARQSIHSSSWLSTAENGLAKVRSDDLRGLLDIYECNDLELRASLEYLAERGRRPGGWWREYEGLLPEALLDRASLEADAYTVFEFHQQVVPGQLQSERYSRALTDLSASGSADAVTEFRMRRHEFLGGPSSPRLQAVICEGGLRLPIGSRDIAREQLAHLRELAERPNIELRIIPDAQGAHPGLAGSFTVLRFKPHGRLSIVLRGGMIQPPPLMDEPSLAVYADIVRRVIEVSLPQEASLELLDRIASAL